MTRKFALVALSTLAVATLVAGSAQASGGLHLPPHPIHPVHPVYPIHPVHPVYPIHPLPPHVHNHHFHWRYVWRHGYRPIYIERAAYAATAPGPCTCLTKEYTPEGVVVFKDLCTKEMASAPVEGAPVQGGQATSPSNFAGKTYQDYLAANPQLGSVETQKN